MEVQTNSPEIRQARRDIVELLLDNHRMDCQTCERDGNCELQNLAYSMGVRAAALRGRAQAVPHRDCPATRSSATPRSASSAAAACASAPRSRASTTSASTAAASTPSSARPTWPTWTTRSASSAASASTSAPRPRSSEKRSTERGLGRAGRSRACTSSCRPPRRSARPSAKASACRPARPATGQDGHRAAAAGLRPVFDTDFGADLTIVEEAHEFLTRLKEGPLPMITSCSPGWINFLEKFYPELIPHASTCRSPMSMLSVLVEDLLRREDGHRPEEDLRGGGHALRGEEVRGRPARALRCPTARPTPTPC